MVSTTNGTLSALVNKFVKKCFPGYWQQRQESNAVRAWVRRGKPSRPPHAVKVRAVKGYAERFSVRTLIETGTYQGAMVESCKSEFKRIYSVELSRSLFESALKQFASDKNVSLLQGDSAEILPKLLKSIDEPCLFWLDAHYSGGNTALGQTMTPIFDELERIFEHRVKNHIILVDDACDFIGAEGYPTVAELKTFVLTRRPGWSFEVRDDIIRLHA